MRWKIFGGQILFKLPRLLVHKEQVEEVKEIIKNLEEEEIEVIETEVFNKSLSEKEEKKEQINGVEGWLLVFCMTLMLGPLAYLSYDINTYFEIKDQQINWIPIKDTILIIDLIITIVISCLSVYAGWSLWKISSRCNLNNKGVFEFCIGIFIIFFLSNNYHLYSFKDSF